MFVESPTAAQLKQNGADRTGVGARATLAPSAYLRNTVTSLEIGAEAARHLNAVNPLLRDGWRFNAYDALRF